MSRYALVIGSQIEGLTGVQHDTFRMGDALRARGFAVDLRFGDTATRRGILDGYDALIAKSPAGDVAVIYYSGHGLYSANSDPADPLRVVQSIAPTDLRSGGDADFRGITAWELAIKLAQLTARTRNVTVILDCCHAAQMTRAAAARDVVPRALPHPVRMGFRRHLAALERVYGKVAVDPVGNPDVVRVVACGQTEAAFEHTNPAGRRAGVFTDALLTILNSVGDAPISWAAIGDAIRERVMRRFALQRPDVEGPSQRQLFSLAIEPRHGAVPVTREGEAFRIQTGWVTGAAAGDVYSALPLGCQAHDDARAIATLRITSTGPMTSLATLDHWHDGHAALPDDAVAIPIEVNAPRHPVVVIAPHAERAAIAHAIEATRTLRLAAAPDGLPAAPIDDAAPLAMLRLTGHQLTIEDLAGPMFPPSRYPDELANALQNVANLGVAQGVRELVGEHGLSAAGLEIGWGVVEAGAPRAMPEHGAALGLGDRIYVRVTNTGADLCYVHVCNVGVRGKVTLLTKPRAPAGVALGRGEAVTLGEYNGRLIGLSLAWPHGLSLDSFPRLDEMFVFVTAQPISLRALETHDHVTRSGPTGSKLQALLAQLHDGLPRTLAGPAAHEAFFVKRLSFTLHPRTAAIADTVAFQVDDDPLRQAAARSPRAWLSDGTAALSPPRLPQVWRSAGTAAPPHRAAAAAAAPMIAIRLGELAVNRDHARSSSERGTGLHHDFRIDALVCTRSPHRTETCVARTLRFHGGAPDNGLAQILCGGIRGNGFAQLFRGSVRDFVDVHLWISHDTTGDRDLRDLLARHATTPRLHDAVTALVIPPVSPPGNAPGSAPPWITAVGASAAVARISYDLVLAVEPTALGLYRAAFLAGDGFGLGRHPAAGLHRTRDLAFSLAIDPVPRTR